MLTVVMVAVALAADAAAVSAGLGAARAGRLVLGGAAVLFGLAQAGMAGLGALGGAWLAENAAAWDHWVALGILVLVGGRMLRGGEGEDAPAAPSLAVLLTLAIATSIDALAAGVALPMLSPPVPLSLAIIGAVTVALSVLAGALGQLAGRLLGAWAERAAGVVLIGIGVLIVAEHLGWTA
jgi:putative Mn2+ efflux pump MntP